MIEQTACFSVFMNLQDKSMFGMMAAVQNMVQQRGACGLCLFHYHVEIDNGRYQAEV
jgi:hypothetical protein